MLVAIVAVLILLGGLGGVAWWLAGGSIAPWPSDRRQTAATFVGSEACAGCHQTQAERWRGSQHKHAMAHATEQSVLGGP
jgi:hypothetical protein